MRSYKFAFVIGTRPEAIKLAPVIGQFAARGGTTHIIMTGQHPGLALSDHGLERYSATPLACPGLPDPHYHSDLVRAAMLPVLGHHKPDLVVVQGDTSSALGGAMATVDCGLRLAHVEAGLRSFDSKQPWPEEDNRVAIDGMADLLFAPTNGNASNLHREGVTGEVHITGNSGIDALIEVVGPFPLRRRRRGLGALFSRRMTILVSCHRRENWDTGLAQLSEALIELARTGKFNVQVILHPNAVVASTLFDLLSGEENVQLLPPCSYAAMVDLMRGADLILSDSGGMQEEAPALGVPLLVLRDKTERPEAISVGNALLVGTDRERIVTEVMRLFADRKALAAMAKPALPFGDGQAAARIAAASMTFVDEWRERDQLPRRA